MSMVPSAYVGLWRRDELVDAQGARDDTTEVYWLQSHGLYVDLRIPAGRPDFRLDWLVADCPPHHREWLSRQEGFAGVLEVQGDLCHWQRDLDLQPPGAFEDRGRIEFLDQVHMIETGTLIDYVERWRKTTPANEQRVLAMRMQPSSRARAGVFVAVGNDFMYAIDWQGEIPLRGRDIEGSLAERTRFRGCEIGYGHIWGSQPWIIERSSLPIVEGSRLLPPSVTIPPVGTDWSPPPGSVLRDTGAVWTILEHAYPTLLTAEG